MANQHGKALDKTHLSIDQAEDRGFIHRDYIAHCLRWSHVCKYLGQQARYKTAHILDIGCGKEVPLAKLMYSSRLVPQSGSYLGIDANRLSVPDTFSSGKFPIQLLSGIFPEALDAVNEVILQDSEGEGLELKYDIIVCFEVAEHVEPDVTLKILQGIKRYLSPNGMAFVSTPCYDVHTGAAANHVNEMGHYPFGALIEHAGLHIDAVYGTFASQKDYKHALPDELTPFYAKLLNYYDSNYVATLFAPLFPKLSRNCLWRLNLHIKDDQPKYPPIKDFAAGDHSSSAKWTSFIESL